MLRLVMVPELVAAAMEAMVKILPLIMAVL